MVKTQALGALVLLVTIFQSTLSQNICVRPPTGERESDWIFAKNNARKVGECQQGYHCINGVPLSAIRCPDSRLYFSLELGVCDWEHRDHMKSYFNSRNCAEEEQKFRNLQLRVRRERVCARFLALYPQTSDQKRIFAGDPDDCTMYFRCHVEVTQESYNRCAGSFFDDTTGECSMVVRDAAKCAKE